MRNAVAEWLTALHTEFAADPRLSAINRLAVAEYHVKTNRLVALASSGAPVPALDTMHCPLDDIPSLAILASGTEPRIINDLQRVQRGPLAADLMATGCRASMTIPLWSGDAFLGFFFVDATQPAFFGDWHIGELRRAATALGPLLGG